MSLLVPTRGGEGEVGTRVQRFGFKDHDVRCSEMHRELFTRVRTATACIANGFCRSAKWSRWWIGFRLISIVAPSEEQEYKNRRWGWWWLQWFCAKGGARHSLTTINPFVTKEGSLFQCKCYLNKYMFLYTSKSCEANQTSMLLPDHNICIIIS